MKSYSHHAEACMIIWSLFLSLLAVLVLFIPSVSSLCLLLCYHLNVLTLEHTRTPWWQILCSKLSMLWRRWCSHRFSVVSLKPHWSFSIDLSYSFQAIKPKNTRDQTAVNKGNLFYVYERDMTKTMDDFQKVGTKVLTCKKSEETLPCLNENCTDV